MIALYSPVIAFLDIRGSLEKSLALFKNSFSWLTSEINDRGSVKHEFEIMYPIKVIILVVVVVLVVERSIVAQSQRVL